MRRSNSARLLAAGAVAAVVLGLGVAARAADTSTSFTLTSGSLSINPPGSSNLGSVPAGTTTIFAQLGTVTVNDNRGASNGSWTASVSSTDFTTGSGTPPNQVVTKANVAYASGPATNQTGTATTTPGQSNPASPVDLSVTRTAFSASAITGNESTSWNPTVYVSPSSSNVAGVYTGTITHSVA
jgi:hypothetical protein